MTFLCRSYFSIFFCFLQGGGRRTRGNRVPQASVSESLNAEELAGNGVKVETLKQLLAARNTPEEGKHTAAGDQTKANQNPPKLISLDQVTVRGEDLTGMLNWYNIIH